MRHRERGQALAWVGMLLLLVLLPLTGLALDTGILFNAHRQLQMEADGAARVGASQLDPSVSYGGERGVLDTQRAREAAEAYLDELPGVTGYASADGDHIEVRAERDVQLGFQQLWGHAIQHIAATAQAVPCTGIAAGQGRC